MSSTSALEAQLRRESAAKVSGMGCWLTKPASEKAPKEKGDAQAAGKAPRKPFALWGSKREVTPPGAPAPDAPASESDDLEGLSSKLFDVDLGALDHPNTPPAKGAKPVPASPVHRRVWSFGRKVAPAVEPEPAPSAEALLDTAQSDDLPRISATSTDSSESSSTATAASAAAGADGIATLAPEQPAARPQGYRRLWQSIVRKGDSVPAHMASQLPDVTVEGIVHRVQVGYIPAGENAGSVPAFRRWLRAWPGADPGGARTPCATFLAHCVLPWSHAHVDRLHAVFPTVNAI